MRMKIYRRKKSIDLNSKKPLKTTHTIKFTGLVPSTEMAALSGEESRSNRHANQMETSPAKQSDMIDIVVNKSLDTTLIENLKPDFNLIEAIAIPEDKKVRKRNQSNNMLSSQQHSKRHTVKLLDSKEITDKNPDLDDVASELDRAMSSLINHKEPYVINNPTPIELNNYQNLQVLPKKSVEHKSEASSMKQISFKEFQSLKSSVREITNNIAEDSYINYD